MPAEPWAARLLHLPLTRLALAASLAACPPSSAPATTEAREPAAVAPRAATTPAGDADAAARATADDAAPPRSAQRDPDGNDDEEVTSGALPLRARFVKVGTPPLALTRICDLTPLGDALYMAHANQPLGTDGATITRYRPADARRPFTVAFDWNRPGEPTKGGGGGQGFVRARAIGGRLFVPDADPPYGGLGVVDRGTEGYVFVSDAQGSFAPARAPKARPPAAPTFDEGGRAGAAVLPRAYHVLDVVRFRGALYASTGSVPPRERAWSGPSPGALHRAGDDGARWLYDVDYPYPYRDGVFRLTYLVRFRDRLYAGIQDYDAREPSDYVVIAPEPAASTLARSDVRAVRITRTGAAQTLRWWVDTRATPARLYWLASTRDGFALRVTTDGERWAQIALPDGAGRPTDVARLGDAVVVLAENGLHRLEGGAIHGARALGDDELAQGVADARAVLVAPAVDRPSADADSGAGKGKPARSPFEVSDFFCTAPLAAFGGELYAGGQRGGTLYKVVPDDD